MNCLGLLFGKVNDFLYRGGQPKDEGIQQLKRLGIDTIVDLRGKLRGVVESERQRSRAINIDSYLVDQSLKKLCGAPAGSLVSQRGF